MEDGVKKSFDDDLFRLCLWNSTRLEIEQRFLFQLANGGAMRAADIIGEDLQAGDRISARSVAQDQISVGLITVSFLCSRRDVDHALPNRATLTLQRTLEQQVAGRVLGKMILLRIMIKMLIAICKIKTGHTTLRAFAHQIKLGEILGQARTDRTKDPIQFAAAVDAGSLVTKIPNVTSPGLQFDEFQRRFLHYLDLDNSRVH